MLPAASIVARLTTDAATARKISDALAECLEPGQVAASAFEEADGRWSLALHFRGSPDAAGVRATVAAAAGAAAAQALTFETLEPTDWVRRGLDALTPVAAGRFVVHGAHARACVRPNQAAIEIEASLAFGTGHHGSTRGCLLALDAIIKRTKLAVRRAPALPQTDRQFARTRPLPFLAKRGKDYVLDVGTGSGVLAIAAAKAWRRRVLASDIDRRAVDIARENARRNRVAGAVATIQANGLDIARFRQRAPFALILANILLEPLQKLATPMARLVARNGRVVLSGLLLAQAGAALTSYRARGLVLERRIGLEGWATLVLTRPSKRRAVR
jgi:ribosomal protein L11 methyltransferase